MVDGILTGSHEVAVTVRGAHRLWKLVEAAGIVGLSQERVILERPVDEGAADRVIGLAVPLPRILWSVHPHILALGVLDYPLQLAFLRRVGVGDVQPGRIHRYDPVAVRGHRRVGRQDHTGALARVDRSHPAHQQPDLFFEEQHRLVEPEEVMRLTDPGHLVPELGRGAELDELVGALRPKFHRVGPRVAVTGLVDLDRPLGHRAHIGVLPPHDQGAVMLLEGETEKQVGLAGTGLTSKQQLISLRYICTMLWTEVRRPLATGCRLDTPLGGDIPLLGRQFLQYGQSLVKCAH